MEGTLGDVEQNMQVNFFFFFLINFLFFFVIFWNF